MNTESRSAPRLYNPDWLSDDELVAGFTARLEMLKFLCGELERTPARGTAHHYLLVGVRGSGKTSLLKRIAVAIRRESRLSGHLIGLSFPEELYEVKGLSDFWWASCRALVDALDNSQFSKIADDLAKQVEEREEKRPSRDPHDEAGLRLMLEVCSQIKKRPVLLVDNLDLVLKRIDKSGRKLKDRQSPAYWALREVLSTATAPIVVGGSVRMSPLFLGHDDAFYDYFVAQRLGKLSLEEVRNVYDHLAGNYGDESLRERIRKRPGRLRALYEMTGGNPRALGLVFELLRQGPNSSAVDAFEQLLDLTTPYYKARFEELPEQAQVVLHALALSRRDVTKVTFGHKAAVIAQRAGLDTRVVSAQLEMLINDGVVEKNKSLGGRTQYRVAEQLFRLWLQMRSTRRIRQQVISLTEFLEALFDRDEYEELIRRETDASHSSSFRSRAKLNLALSELQHKRSLRYYLETRAADAILEGAALDGSQIEGIFAPGDLSDGIEFEARTSLQKCALWHKTLRSDAEYLKRSLLGSLRMSREEKRAIAGRLCDRQKAVEEFARIVPVLEEERQGLRKFLSDAEIDLLFSERASGRLSLPHILPEDVEATAGHAVRSLAWKLLRREIIGLASEEVAGAWVDWGKKNFPDAESSEWAEVASVMRGQNCLLAAQRALDLALASGDNLDAWFEQGRLYESQKKWAEAESAYRRALKLNPSDHFIWSFLGNTIRSQHRYDEAEAAYQHALRIDAKNNFALSWLGDLLTMRGRYDDAESAYRKAIEIAPQRAFHWSHLANLLATRNRFSEAEAAYRKAIEIQPSDDFHWISLGAFFADRSRPGEAEAAYRKALEIKPSAHIWCVLGDVLASQSRHDEVEATYRNAIKCDPNSERAWISLGGLLESRSRLKDAESAFLRAIEIAPTSNYSLVLYGIFLANSDRLKEAEYYLRRAIEREPHEFRIWNMLGALLGRQARLDEAMEAFSKGLELNPDDSGTRALLEKTRNLQKVVNIITACGNGDWEQARKGLANLMSAKQEAISWLTHAAFLKGVVRNCLRRGEGPKLLATLREVQLDSIALPLILALDAVIEGNEEKLETVEPETRSAAQFIFKQLTADSD